MTEALSATVDLFAPVIVPMLATAVGGWFVLLIVRAIKGAIR